MERLIYSSTIPSKVYGTKTYLPPQVGRLERRKLGLSPALGKSSPGVKSSSCKHYLPQTFCFSKLTDVPIDNSIASDDLTNGSMLESKFVANSAQKNSNFGKGTAVGKLILLAALTVTLIHPLLTSPALASFPAAAKTGGVVVGSRLLRTEILSSAWTGFFAGCLHTLSGPDHLAALAPLSIGRTKMESAAVGALWGCGHDAGQVIFGLLFLILKDRLHIEILQTWGSRVVGLTLLIIGAMGIKEATEIPTPCVALENGECDDVSEVYEVAMERPVLGGSKKTTKKKKIGFATFATGIVHGLQPDALMIILPALALPSRFAGAAFLFMFLVGTVVSMGGYTAFIGSCSDALKDRIPRITEKLTWASSLVAIGLGLAILISQAFGLSLY